MLRLKSLKAEYCTLRHKGGLNKYLEKNPINILLLRMSFWGI